MAPSSYFALFDIPPAFDLDLVALGDRYRALAKDTHPDRYADTDDATRRQAVQRSASLNEAYQVLKTPALRAHHLLALQGRAMDLEATIQDPEFLMQQLAWREELEALQEAVDLSGISAFKKRLYNTQQDLAEAFSACWQDAAQSAKAERLIRRMQFLDKLSQQVRQLEERLDD